MITLDLSKGEPVVHATGSLTITFDHEYTPELWEFVEDAVADKLSHMNLKGSIESSVTGNSTKIKNNQKESYEYYSA